MDVTCMNVRLYKCTTCTTVRLYTTGDLMERDKTGRMRSGLKLQYKHSANILGYDIIVNKLSH